MKKYILLMTVLGLFSCNSTKEATNTERNISETSKIVVNEGSCPEAGTCSFQIKEGTAYVMEKDGTGALYPKYEESSGSLAEFRYEEKGPEGTADGDYTEVIQFMIPSSLDKGKSYTGEGLQEVGLLYYKQCFCKGQAGYYEVKEGALKIFNNKEGELNFDLQFTVAGVRHTIHRIVRQ